MSGISGHDRFQRSEATSEADKSFGGLSVIGGDKPLYHCMSQIDIEIHGHVMYHEFKQVIAFIALH